MDLISLYYFSELAKDLHMTRTANRLFISQQTLSNHIQRLERYYHARLFHRKPALSLTTAGEVVLGFAEAILKENTNLRDILSDLERQERGVLRFGASPLRLSMCLPAVLPAFTARYPNVSLRITDTVGSQLEPLVLDGSLDFAITLNEGDSPKLVCHSIMDARGYLCVADSLLTSCYGGQAGPLKKKALAGACLEDFAALPFCIFDNQMGWRVNRCFEEARVTPHAYITTTYTQIATTICFQRLAACFCPQMSLATLRREIPPDINIFPLLYKNRPLTQSLSLIRLKDRYLSHYSKFFLDLIFQQFSEIERIDMERIV